MKPAYTALRIIRTVAAVGVIACCCDVAIRFTVVGRHPSRFVVGSDGCDASSQDVPRGRDLCGVVGGGTGAESGLCVVESGVLGVALLSALLAEFAAGGCSVSFGHGDALRMFQRVPWIGGVWRVAGAPPSSLRFAGRSSVLRTVVDTAGAV